MPKGSVTPMSSHNTYASFGGNANCHGGNYGLRGLQTDGQDGMGGNIGDAVVKASRYAAGSGNIDDVGVKWEFAPFPTAASTIDFNVQGLNGSGVVVTYPVVANDTVEDHQAPGDYNSDTVLTNGGTTKTFTNSAQASGQNEQIQFADVPSPLPPQPIYPFGPHTPADQAIDPKLTTRNGCPGTIVCVCDASGGEVKASAFEPINKTPAGTIAGQDINTSYLPGGTTFEADLRKFLIRNQTQGNALDLNYSQVPVSVLGGGGFGRGFPSRNLNIINGCNMMPLTCGQGWHIMFRYNRLGEVPCTYYGGSFGFRMWLSFGGFGAAPSGGTPGLYLPMKWGTPGSWVDGATNDISKTWGDVNNMRCFGVNPENPGYTTNGVPANMNFTACRIPEMMGGFSGLIKWSASVNGTWFQPAQKTTGACNVDIRMIIQRKPPSLGGTGLLQYSKTLKRIRMEHSGQGGSPPIPINYVAGSGAGIVPCCGLAEGTNAGSGIPILEDGDLIALYANVGSESRDGGGNYNYFDMLDCQVDMEFLANP